MVKVFLGKAFEIAEITHRGKFDKGGTEYILHPMRVMLKQKDDTHRIVALLHDVLEDGDSITRNLFYAYEFPYEIEEAVVAITKTKHEDYFDYIKRVGRNKIARTVKLADLEDNMDLTRIKNITLKDLARVDKYKEAKRMLESMYNG